MGWDGMGRPGRTGQAGTLRTAGEDSVVPHSHTLHPQRARPSPLAPRSSGSVLFLMGKHLLIVLGSEWFLNVAAEAAGDIPLSLEISLGGIPGLSRRISLWVILAQFCKVQRRPHLPRTSRQLQGDFIRNRKDEVFTFSGWMVPFLPQRGRKTKRGSLECFETVVKIVNGEKRSF